MTPEQLAAFKKLKTYEQQADSKSFKLEGKLLNPVEDSVEKEMNARTVQ